MAATPRGWLGKIVGWAANLIQLRHFEVGTCDLISASAQLASMLLPRFSIRTALAILTGVAVVSLFAGQALGGRAWAFGLTVAVASVPLALLVHAGFFALASAFSSLVGPEDIVAYTSRGGVERSNVNLAPATDEASAPQPPVSP